MAWVLDALGPGAVSERRACRVLGQVRSTQRRACRSPDDEPRLLRRIVELATQYGRYGYRRVTALLRGEGFRVNHKRVERLWRREGLKVPGEAAEAETALAQRRLLCPAQAGLPEPRLDLRLRVCPDHRRPSPQVAHDAG